MGALTVREHVYELMASLSKIPRSLITDEMEIWDFLMRKVHQEVAAQWHFDDASTEELAAAGEQLFLQVRSQKTLGALITYLEVAESRGDYSPPERDVRQETRRFQQGWTAPTILWRRSSWGGR
ncbi:hypothetical protein EPN83_00695 [Patescibacteria group bacterium]|nr:MAG: hypothetical protein EPN83_00695 [Patescibacteria group bacterium]